MKMNRSAQRILSFILSILLIVGMFPVSGEKVYAAEDDVNVEQGVNDNAQEEVNDTVKEIEETDVPQEDEIVIMTADEEAPLTNGVTAAEPDPVADGDTSEETATKIDVWDFGAEALDESLYNNLLTVDVINSVYEGVAPGTGNTPIASFTLGDLSFADGGYPKTHRLRSRNTQLTRYDDKNLTLADDSSVVFNGYIYSNKSSTDSVYLSLANVQAGDILTWYVGSNGGDSSVIIEKTDGEDVISSSHVYTSGSGKAEEFVFYAPKAGTYKIYSANEKLVVARILREHTALATVSGKVTYPADLENPVLVFTNDQNNSETEAAVAEDGTYTVELNEKYSYTVSLKDANGYVVTDKTSTFKLDKGVGEKTHDVVIKGVSLKTIKGNITFDGSVSADIVKQASFSLSTTNEKALYVPEFSISENGTYSVQVETGVSYTLNVDGINDYELKNYTWFYVEDTDGVDLAFTSKPKYKITINPSGVKLDELYGAKIVFTNLGGVAGGAVEDEGYTYTFTIEKNSNISLRDGVYSVVVGDAGVFGELHQDLTANLTVSGKAVSCTIPFYKGKFTSWTFTDSDWVNNGASGEGSWHGLEYTNAKPHNKVYMYAAGESEIKIPVSKGKAKLNVNFCYSGKFSFDDDETVYEATDSKGSTGKSDTVSIDINPAKDSYVVMKVAEAIYINYISVNEVIDYKETVKVDPAGKGDYKTINEALAAVRLMDRSDEQEVTISIAPGNYEEMLVIDVSNIKLANAAGEDASIELTNKGVDIAKNAVRITSYYGHGYTYYSMGSDCKWNADVLATNKANGYASFVNPGSGTTYGSYWNATVVINANNVTAEGIIFENSFNQYVSKKAAEDVIVKQNSAREGTVPRAEMEEGSTLVQQKKYVERAAALAMANNSKQIYFDNCKFVGRQDTLYGGTGVKAAFNECAIYGGTDYIFGPMTAAFNHCDLVFNTYPADSNDVGYITAPQQASGRGYVFYECDVVSTTPGVDTIATSVANPGGFGRPWAVNTGEAVFVKTLIGTAAGGGSLIQPEAWFATLSGESALCGEYLTTENSGVDNSSKRASWATVFTEPVLADGTAISFEAFLGDWKPFGDVTMDLSKAREADESIDQTIVTITLNPGYSGGEAKTQSVVKGTKLTKAELTGLTRKGYTISGWLDERKRSVNFPITVTEDITLTAVWKSNTIEDSTSEVGELVAEFDDDAVDTSGSVATMVYSGSKLTPAVKVSSNGEELINGVDYTIKYANNVKVSDKPATITVSGKGNYSGKKELSFKIVAADIADAYVSNVVVAEGKKAAPVVVYNGIRLTANKDYTLSKTDALTASSDPVSIGIIGKGNFANSYKEEEFTVVPAASLKKINVKLNAVNKVYNGDEQTLTVSTSTEAGEVDIKDASSGAFLTEDDYVISYTPNVNAGTVRVTIAGDGLYSGVVSKTFKINPAKTAEISATLADGDSYAYVAGGVTPKLDVAWTPEEGDKIELVEGTDYKVSYSKNKQAGLASYSVTYLGNFKGHAPEKNKSFTITKANADEAYVEVSVYDMVFNKGTTAAKYLQAPQVTVDGALLSSKEYEVSYYWGSAKIDKTTPVLATEDMPYEITVKVKINNEKSKNYKGSDEYVGTYNIIASSAKDMAKAKITFWTWSSKKNAFVKTTKLGYTGEGVAFGTSAEVKKGKAQAFIQVDGVELSEEFYDVAYVNNVNRGKASVIITAAEGSGYAGGKAQSFTIAQLNFADWLTTN